MKLSCLAALLLLAGCAGNQSAFPVAPPFDPVTDSPITIGHPGAMTPGAEPLPPSSHKRILPATKESGIYAGDTPRASRDGGAHLLGIYLPPPYELMPDTEAEELAVTCAYEGLQDIERLPPGLRLPFDSKNMFRDWFFQQSHCLAARLYLDCATRRLLGTHSGARKILESISEWAKQRCSIEHAESPEVKAAVDAIAQMHRH